MVILRMRYFTSISFALIKIKTNQDTTRNMSTSKSGNNWASITRKVAMALSGFFLLVFLLQHVAINFLSVINPEIFNITSHFMGTNPLVQYGLQPVLTFAVVFHIALGVVLEIRNRSKRPISYAYSKPSANSTWMSRNMIITGIMVLLFMGLHYYDFWFPELKLKFVDGDMSGLNAAGEMRYFEELQHKFQDPIRVIIYILSFIFLGLHLTHGFQSAFQSVGLNHKRYTPIIKSVSRIYAVVVPLGFTVIALYHFLA